jgi:hypothetical protein
MPINQAQDPQNTVPATSHPHPQLGQEGSQMSCLPSLSFSSSVQGYFCLLPACFSRWAWRI